MVRHLGSIDVGVVVGQRAAGGRRDERNDVRGDLAEAVGGDGVVREGSPGGGGAGADGAVGIVDDLRNPAEVALGLGGGRDGVHDGSGRDGPQIVVAGEVEEGVVAAVVDLRNPDRSADAAAGGVQAILRAEARLVGGVLIDAPTGGFPDIAAHVVGPGAVVIVGAAPRGEDFDSAADAPVFGGVSANQQLDFAEGFGRGRIEDRAARLGNHVAGAIDELLARAAGRAGDARFRALIDARHVSEEGRRILQAAGPQRQGLVHFRRQRLAALAGFGFEQRLRGGDFHALFDVADFQFQIEDLPLRDEDLDAVLDGPLEAGFFRSDGPDTGRQVGKDIDSGFGRDRVLCNAGAVFPGSDGRACYRRTALIRHSTRQGPGLSLAEGKAGNR